MAEIKGKQPVNIKLQISDETDTLGHVGADEGPGKTARGKVESSKAVSRVARMCGIEVPVFQAGMAGLAGPELVSEVSEAGGLGHLGALRVPPKLLRQWIDQTRGVVRARSSLM